MAGVMLVFDFGKTIIECDSDYWFVKVFGVSELFTQLRPTLPWNTLMVRCDLRIISDANVFFIKAILKNHGLLDCFSEINTNPSYVDGEGRLRVSPYLDFESSSHGCNICPPNMCKGLIIERIQASVSATRKKRFIYLGDGTADFCPGLKLREDDFLMPRKYFPIWELICSNLKLIKANNHEWNDGEELGTVLSNLINKIFIEENCAMGINQIVPVDCKFQTSSV
ncbi:hypothetical protein CRYUN_Cryun26dG0028800 [Craigia yunnanensis]